MATHRAAHRDRAIRDSVSTSDLRPKGLVCRFLKKEKSASLLSLTQRKSLLNENLLPESGNED